MTDIRDLGRAALAVAGLLLVATTPAWAGSTERVSVSSSGTQGDGLSIWSALSADGRFVVFLSDATNLVLGDTNLDSDVFVRNRRTGTTKRVSHGLEVQTGGGGGGGPSLSADGRFVAFFSNADNVVPGDTNGQPDVFVRDRRTGRTERVSGGPDGVQADGGSAVPSLSADGRFVAFDSDATNLVPGDTNGQPDVFVRDRRTGRTERVSVGPGGVQADGGSGSVGDFGLAGLSLSADGRFVAFGSDATNLVPGDTNGMIDVFVHDRQAGTTERVSMSSRDDQARGGEYGSIHPALSANGRLVAFWSDATNLVPGDTNGVSDVFVRDRVKGTIERVSVGLGGVQADGGSDWPALSADGRFVVFTSNADNLVPGDTNGLQDVFVRDRVKGTTERVSVGPGGVQADGDSDLPALSADGRSVAFTSEASNLVPGDTNNVFDVFVHTR